MEYIIGYAGAVTASTTSDEPLETQSMEIAHEKNAPWDRPPPVRGGSIQFKTLLEGVEGSSSNFHLFLADTDTTFKSPRHRHNFDQLRFGLSGRTNIGPAKNIEIGDVVYFPEGTRYGPQNQDETGEKSLCLVVQLGGPAGNGYMSKRQLAAGLGRLQKAGVFEGGVFTRHAPTDGDRKNQDSYEAIWEDQNGRPVSYSRERYLEPIHMREANFDWQPVPGNAGTSVKHLGSFTEKEVALDFLRLDTGASYRVPASPGHPRILFVCDGTGRMGDSETWFPHSAVHLAADESLELRAESLTQILVLHLPSLDGG
jgi:hypothetical protein